MSHTGTVALRLSEGGSRLAPVFRTLASIVNGPRTARVVRIALDSAEGPSRGSGTTVQRYACGVWWGRQEGMPAPWYGGGALRIRYGSGGALRLLYLDLAPGEFQLPPCSNLGIDAALWDTDEDDTASRDPAVVVSCDLDDGVIPDPSPMVVTARRRYQFTEGTGLMNCPAPPGAYAVDVAATPGVPIEIRAGDAYAVRDFAGAWLPPTTPVLITPVALGTVNVAVRGPSAGPWTSTLSFWVR